MRHPSDTELNDFADGTSPAEAREALARHLEACPACRAEVEAIHGLLDEVGGLPPERPERDLWPGIAERIEAKGRGSGPTAPIRGGRRPHASPVWLAAAAVALVAASSAVTAWVVGGGPREPVPATVAEGPGDSGSGGSSAETGVALPAAARALEAQYEASIDRLLRVLRERRDRLAPETRTVVDRNLEVIDSALLEIRQALVEDPSSARLLRALSDGYERKLQLLREAALAPVQL